MTTHTSHFVKQLYFKEITGKKIISKKEQLAYSKEIYQLKNQLTKITDPKKQKQIEEKIKVIRNKLIESCYLIVVKIAKKYRNRYLSLFDLIEEGNLVLVKAIDTFDYKKDVKFSTYISVLVKSKILTAITNRRKVIRVNAPYQYTAQNFTRINSPGQAPFRTITKQLGVDSSKMLRAIKNLQEVKMESEKSISQEKFDSLFFHNGSGKNPTEFELFKSTIKENIQKINKVLSSKENEIIIRYYGLENKPPQRYNKIAKDIKLTSERVRQIHNQAIKKIKNSEMNLILKEFLSDDI